MESRLYAVIEKKYYIKSIDRRGVICCKIYNALTMNCFAKLPF